MISNDRIEGLAQGFPKSEFLTVSRIDNHIIER